MNKNKKATFIGRRSAGGDNMDWGSPKEMITSTDSSSDGESIVSDVSINGNEADAPILPLTSNTWNIENSGVINTVFLEQGGIIINNCLSTSTTPAKTPHEEYDQSLSSYVISVSPSDEEAYQQEINGDVTDLSSENGCTSTRSKLGDQRLSSRPMKKDFSNNVGENSNHEIGNSSITKGCSPTPTSRIEEKVPENASVDQNAKSDFTISLSPELNALIDEQKASLVKGFLDWKAELPKHYGNRLGLLSEVFRLNLKALAEGEYWFGPDFIMDSKKQIAPKDATFVGLILSEGSTGKKFLVLNGRERVELNEGYTEGITPLLTVQVNAYGILSMYNKDKVSYQNVCAGPSNLLFNYNPDMVFTGIITSDKTFKVKILGHDVEFNLDVFGNECQVVYIDHMATFQKIYPVRASVLNVLSERLALIDFNYSFPCNIDGSIQPKIINILIPAGANPYYF
ncbi:hypothetical protein HDV04_005315 [Boothiomyces sp. JEL0838]|nr:hypothetical protein HDV04_005315 [Boothiomyces sp. JEL0838]